MEYRKYGEAYYVRMDPGDEITSKLIELCKECGIESATYSGIGGCGRAEIQTFNFETREYDSQIIEGMLELVAINGNIEKDESGKLVHHSHATFAYKEAGEHKIAAGHLKETEILITAEIELRPVCGGQISRKMDPQIGIKVWSFD